ncbi:NADP-dependent oxidoreductase domain-containing protein [Gamsiella multidivaricata]|uniref:NADP-dependent oxidoreductase domain-containing protein n=1 Tax=Gamsiella multidivaricata TaxID=101098 RepID=UPI00221F7421|nr:NADP-dependent oxidoreductase domain-containing protein [Gamsiella multidivaricata]KAI7817082.1 NADP-dependent oxidoreductase domain-containing protein [Gamsiella multidivaricata]
MLSFISFHTTRQCRGVAWRQTCRHLPTNATHRCVASAARALNTAATPESTAAFVAKHPALPSTTIPKRGLVLSKLGFGAYRVNETQPAHRAALLKAIQAGVNVIDTSSHFGHGASEKFVGSTLQELFKEDKVKREEVVVVSKAGFILPPTSTFPTDSLENVPSYAKISESSYHSIHPSYLKFQITASLTRLQLDKLDIFMINNPERMLGDKHLPGGYSKTRLYKEIAEAFAYLDQEVADGRIGGYGICSNALHLPTTEDHLSLKAIMRTRADFGWKKENFVAIEVPLNLFERELVTDVFPAKSLAREAKEFDLFVFTNRPLNAIAGGQIVTLENKGQHTRQETSTKLLETLDLSFTSLAEMELDIKEMIEEESLAMKFVWSEVLSENLSRLSSNYFAAKHFLEREVLPAIDRDLKILEDSITTATTDEQDREDKDAVLSWIDRYRKEAKVLTTDMATFCQLDSDKRNDELNLVLGLICKDFVSDVGPHKVENIGSPLSTKSIQFCTAQENVGCTLVGMRTPEYVYDAVVAAEASKRLTKKDLELISQCPLLLATSE